MSDLDDFLKLVSEAKQQSPVAQKVKEVKTNIKEDLGDLFSQLSVIKEQDPVQQKHKKIEKQVQESVKMDLNTLFSQLSNLKNDLEQELVVAEAKLVEVKQEKVLTEVSPIPAVAEIKTPEQRIKDTNADVDKYLTGKTFQQPDPDLVSKDVEAIRNKIKFLEQAIGKIAATGPGGGEVNLRWLDDVDRSTIADGLYLRYNDTKKKFEFAAVSGGGVSQIQSDWNQTTNTALDFIKNKPTLATVATSGSYDDLTNKPTLATVATSGSYADLTNKPTIPNAQIQSDWNQSTDTALDFIKNKPTLATAAITGGTINGATIGATTPSTGNFTTLSSTNNATISGIATFAAGSPAEPSITTTGDSNTGIFFPAADTIAFTEGGVESMRIDSAGNVGIGTTTPGYKLQVNGTFAATSKSFVIPHPTKEGKQLRYGSLEGPENGVYIRGKLKDNNIIELPEYWTKLVDPDSITVNLTPIGQHQNLYVNSIENNKVLIGNDNLINKNINCFFVVYAERIDIDKLIVEM